MERNVQISVTVPISVLVYARRMADMLGRSTSKQLGMYVMRGLPENSLNDEAVVTEALRIAAEEAEPATENE